MTEVKPLAWTIVMCSQAKAGSRSFKSWEKEDKEDKEVEAQMVLYVPNELSRNDRCSRLRIR